MDRGRRGAFARVALSVPVRSAGPRPGGWDLPSAGTADNVEAAMKRERGMSGALAHWAESGPDKVATWAGSLADFARPLRQDELADADRITTVVLPLGPYRNLTTMTAALFAFHPNAVVLNHAADRIFGSRSDPFAALDPARWRRFKATALRLLAHGRKSSYGGNVLLSHAFRTGPLRPLYHARFGDTLRKPAATTLFWKDSMRFQNRFESGRPPIEAFFAAHDQSRFVFPVRNPMDCTRSNLATGHARHLVPMPERQFGPVLTRILQALRWFRLRERAAPDRFWSFTEDELGDGFLDRFAAFCRVPEDAGWREDGPRTIEIVPKSEHTEERRTLYVKLVGGLFADDLEMRARLERFL